jgi:hypothetical protein
VIVTTIFLRDFSRPHRLSISAGDSSLSEKNVQDEQKVEEIPVEEDLVGYVDDEEDNEQELLPAQPVQPPDNQVQTEPPTIPKLKNAKNSALA